MSFLQAILVKKITEMKTSKNTQNKAESITVRINPKLKYGLELLSRKQHRTISSVVEWAIERAIQDSQEGLWSRNVEENILDHVWDIDESDRLANLAISSPTLLSYEEEVLWKLIKENGAVWKGHFNADGEYTWSVSREALNREILRKHWETFKEVAEGTKQHYYLPSWKKNLNEDIDPLPF